MRTLLADARFGLKALGSARAMGAAAVLVLALGLGATSAIFSVASALLLKPLPLRDPDKLALVFENLASRRSVRLTPSAPIYQELRAERGLFDDVAAIVRDAGSLDAGGRADPVSIARATSGFLPLFGATLELGRPFLPGEDVPGHDQVAVLSHDLWVKQFGGDPAALGRQITLDGVARTVVGVLPRGFTPFVPADVWTPLALTREQLAPDRRDYGLLLVAVRLRDNVTFPAAQARLDALSFALREAHPDSARSGLRILPLRDVFLGDLRPSLLLLMGAVGLLLLIACANVANLLLVRASARQRELAIRAALGAGRARLMRQLVAEGVAVALLGAGLGLLLALWAIELLVPLGSEAIRSSGVEVDGRVLAFTLAVAVVAGAIVGLVPALQSTRPDLTTHLKDGARRGTAGARRFLRDGLVVIEVALALVLLIAAGHEVRSYRDLLAVDPGFQARPVLTASVSLPPSRYPDGAAQARFFDALVQRAAAVPGAQEAGFLLNLPLGGGGTNWHFDVEGPGGRGSGHVVELLQVLTPGTLPALQIPIAAGRGLASSDDALAPRVALVNRAFARRFWPGDDAVGRKIRPYRFHFEDAGGHRYWALDAPEWFTVVGVAGDVRQVQLSVGARPEVYLALDQFPVPAGTLVVRAVGEASSLGEGVRAQLAALDPSLAPQELRPLRDVVVGSAAQRRDPMILLALLAVLALLMAGMGVYGVMSWMVAERGRELSIRLALGAEPRGVWKLVLGHGLSLTLLGIAAGLAAAFALVKPLGGISLGLSRLDPWLSCALALPLVGVALVATWMPARKASRIDPRIAFRLD